MASRLANRTLFSALVQTQHLFQVLRATAALRKIPLAHWLYCQLYKQLAQQQDLSIEVFGNRIFLDSQDLGMSRALLLAHGEWEPAETQVVQSLVGNGMTFVDIGANIGYYTVLAAGLVGPQGRVIAFEPSPSNLSILRRNIKANGYTNVVLVSKAVSDYCGIAQFEIDCESSGTNRLSSHKVQQNSILVETVTLDDYFADSDTNIDFIKLDAEGAEPLILAGMKQVIKRSPKLALLTEFSAPMIRAQGHSPEAFLQDLSAAGFTIHPITAARSSNHSLTPKEASELAVSSTSTNLLCLRDQGAPQQRQADHE